MLADCASMQLAELEPICGSSNSKSLSSLLYCGCSSLKRYSRIEPTFHVAADLQFRPDLRGSKPSRQWHHDRGDAPTLLKVPDDCRSSWGGNRQCIAALCLEFHNVGVVVFRAVDHSPVLARRSHSHAISRPPPRGPVMPSRRAVVEASTEQSSVTCD